MYCTHCGTEIHDQAVMCPKCGVATQNFNQIISHHSTDHSTVETNGIAIAGFVCSFFIPLLGWIFGGIGLGRANVRNGKHKSFAIAAIAVASFMFLLNMILILV